MNRLYRKRMVAAMLTVAHDKFMAEVNRVTAAVEQVAGEDGFQKQAMTESAEPAEE